MKKFLAILCFVLLGATSYGKPVVAQDGDDPEVTIIPLIPGELPNPKGPGTSPIEAFLYTTDAITIVFNTTLGSVGCSIVNVTASTVQNGVLSGTGITVVPISGASGDYTITFTLSSGMRYYGEFSIN